MDDEGPLSRRRYLELIGVSSLGGFAGCSEQSEPSQPTTTTYSTAARSETRTEPPGGTSTDTSKETETPDQWEVDPVEPDGLIGAYYYQWYHGDDGYGLHDERPWLEHVPGEPVLGGYHSRDEDVINQHLKWALEHGINWFMAHGAHPGSYDELTLREHVLEAELADRMQFSFITGIPNKFRQDGQYDMDDPELRRIVGGRLAEFEDRYFDRDNYLAIDGDPLVMYYAIGNLTGDVLEAWDEIRGALDGDVYLVADPHMVFSPGFAQFETPAWELAEAFDAFTEYDMNPILQSRYGEFNREDLRRQYRDWRIAAEDYGVDFIPMTLPGEDHSEIKWTDPQDFYLERDPDRFRRLCRDALTYRDSDIDAVLVTSFNEWPEYTSVEPAESYGTTYLEIVEEELARGQQDSLQAANYVPLDLKFNRTVAPEGDSVRQLAFQLGAIELQDAEGTTVIDYDVGIRSAEPVFTHGVYTPYQDPGSTLGASRWLGGPDAHSRIYLDPVAETANHVTLTGRPISREITAQIRYGGENQGELQFDDGMGNYDFSTG